MVEEIFCELCLEVSQLFYEHQKCSNYRKMNKKKENIDHAKRPVCTRTLAYPRNGYSFNRDNFQNSFISFLKRNLL